MDRIRQDDIRVKKIKEDQQKMERLYKDAKRKLKLQYDAARKTLYEDKQRRIGSDFGVVWTRQDQHGRTSLIEVTTRVLLTPRVYPPPRVSNHELRGTSALSGFLGKGHQCSAQPKQRQ